MSGKGFLTVAMFPFVCACVVMPAGPSLQAPPSGSGSITFPVPGANPPTLASITPSSGTPGALVSVAFTGTNFKQNDTYVTIDGTGVAIAGFSVKSATAMTADISVGVAAPIGPRYVRLSSSGGNSEVLTFEVVSPQPPVSSPKP